MAGPAPRDQENRWKQYLEDERIALFLQNEEFMKELQRNRDFLLALERGGAPGPGGGGALWPRLCGWGGELEWLQPWGSEAAQSWRPRWSWAR